MGVGMREYRYIQEIYEQPEGLQRTLVGSGPEADALARDLAGRVERVMSVGCGDPHFLSYAAAHAFEQLAGLPAAPVEGLEFVLYGGDRLTPRTLLVAISQSGKTVQAIQAVRLARDAGAFALAVTNSPHGPVTESADAVLLTRCGPSYSFPTKTTTSALALLFRLAVALGEARGHLQPERVGYLRHELDALPARVETALGLEPEVRTAAERLSPGTGIPGQQRRNRDGGATAFTFLGTGPGYATALLAEAKVKETVQARAEAHQLEEYAHLHVFVLQRGDPLFFIAPSGRVSARAREVAAYAQTYGAVCVAVTGEEERAAWEEMGVETWTLPAGAEVFSPVVQIVPFQLLTYHLALINGRNPDRPEGLDNVRLQKLIYSDLLEGWHE